MRSTSIIEHGGLRGARFAAALVLALLLGPGPAAAAEEAREAARRFGAALTTSSAHELRPVLPTQGKVRLKLERLGPEEGFFSPGQVEAIFRDFLSRGSVRSFVVGRVESDGSSYCLVHGRINLVDRHGRPARAGLHLSFQPEAKRWVLREIKETQE